MYKIELRHVNKRFGTESLFEGLDIGIQPGSITMLMGPSGSGKSTLLHLIAGLVKEDSGEILIDGCNMFDRERNERDLAMVFQHNTMVPSMTIRESLEYDLRKTIIPKVQWDRLIQEVAEVMGLERQLSLKPLFLSGGQRQRAVIARAVLRKPEILLLDEPLAGLDAVTRRHILAYFRKINREYGTTFVYVTHVQEEAMLLGSEIVLLENGRIRQQARPGAIRHNPANLFSAAFIGTPPMNLLNLSSLNPFRNLRVSVPPAAGTVGFRPDRIRLANKPFTDNSHGLYLTGISDPPEPVANGLLMQIHMDAGTVQAVMPDAATVETGRVWLRIGSEDLLWFSEDGSRIAVDTPPAQPVTVQDWMMAEVR